MNNKNDILLDTNILIYFFKDDTDFYKISVSILENEKFNLYITTKNISELFAVLTKQKVSWSKILLFYEDIKQNISILYPDHESTNVFKELCTKYKPIGNQVFDIEIVSIMLANRLKVIATFNNKDFKNLREVQILEDCL